MFVPTVLSSQFLKDLKHTTQRNTTHLTTVTYLKAIEQGLEVERERRVRKFTAQESERETTEIMSLTTEQYTEKTADTPTDQGYLPLKHKRQIQLTFDWSHV